MPDNYFDDKLNSLKKFIVPDKKAGHSKPALPARYQRLAEALGGTLVTRDEGAYCLVRTLYETGSRLGQVVLERPTSPFPLSLSAFSAMEAEGDGGTG